MLRQNHVFLIDQNGIQVDSSKIVSFNDSESFNSLNIRFFSLIKFNAMQRNIDKIYL